MYVRNMIIVFFGMTLFMLPFQNCAPMHDQYGTLDSPSAGTDGLSDAEVAAAFSDTLHPFLETNCGGCHGGSQSPRFAVSDPEQAVQIIFQNSLVDLNDPANSHFVDKINSGHNGFPSSWAAQIQGDIQAWSDAMVPAGSPGDGSSRDTEAPAVMLTSPSDNATVDGTITLTAIATDNVGVAGVQFYLDDQAWGAPDMTAPYSITVNTAGITNEDHILHAEAWDSSGNTGSSAEITITIDNAESPGGNPLATFSWISANILGPRCVNCHGSGRAEDGVRYNTYANTLATVRANDANRSKFYTEINSGSMPEGSGNLSATQIQAVRDWINNGALNN